MAPNTPNPRKETLELHEVEPRRDLFESAMSLAYEKMDLAQELRSLTEQSGFDSNNLAVQKVQVEMGLLDTQIDSIATQWAKSKVSDLVNDPDRYAKRSAVRKDYFLKRLESQLKRNERKIDRYEKTDENDERDLDRRFDRKNRRNARRDSRQDARQVRRDLDGRDGRQGAREVRRDGRQSLRIDRNIDRLERNRDRKDDRRDAETVVYNKGQIGDPGMPNNSDQPSYEYRGDQADYSPKNLARRFIDGGLEPSVLLVIGSRTPAAIDLAFDREEAAYLKDALNQDPNSMEYKEAHARLKEKQKPIDEAYRFLKHGELARRQVETATVQSGLWSKFSGLATEVWRNPEAMVAMMGLGVGFFLLRDKIFPKETGGAVKTALGGILLATGGVYSFDFIWKKLDKEHRGLFDRLGFKPADLFSGEILDKYRKDFFPTLPEENRDAIDDMIKVFNVPMTRMNDVFEKSLDNQVVHIDTGAFIGQTIDGKDPLSSKLERTMDGTDMYRGLSWFYNKCADKAIEQNPSLAGKDQDAKLRLGLAYARQRYSKMSFKEAVYMVTLGSYEHSAEKPASAERNTYVAGATRVEYFDRGLDLPEDSRLIALASQYPSFGQALLGLPNGDVLVKGCPYQYSFSDQGKHVFTSHLDGKVYPISKDLQKGEMGIHLEALVQASEQSIREKFKTLTPGKNLDLSYRSSGEWFMTPSLSRRPHAGVKTGDQPIDAFIFADSDGLHMSHGQAKKNQSFSSLEEMQDVFDKEVAFPALLKRDVNHLLLGLDFVVQSVTDDPNNKSTTLQIEYGHGHRGTIVYKNGSIESILLDEDAQLQQKWETKAQEETTALFSKPHLESQIVSATGKTFTEMMSSVLNSNSVTGDPLQEKERNARKALIDQQLRAQAAVMNKGFVDELYSKQFSTEQFEVKRKELISTYETAILSILSQQVDLDLNAVELNQMKDLAESAMEEALAPLNDASWQTDQIQENLYKDRLAYWTTEVALAIDVLGAPPVKKSKVEQVIEDYRIRASKEASRHRGQSPEASRTLLWKNQLNGAYAHEWEASSQQVEAYLLTRFKWKPDQITEMMKLYLSKIDHGKFDPSTAKMPPTASGTPQEEYTRYFFSSIFAIMGAQKGGLGGIAQWTTEDIKNHLAQFQRINPYNLWAQAPEIHANPPGLENANELYKKAARDTFVAWFDEKMDLSTLTGLEGDWPNTFHDHVLQRLDGIVLNSKADPLQIQKDLKRFAEFVAVEYWLYKICIDGTYAGKTDVKELRDRIIGQNFNTIWQDPKQDYNAYFASLDPKFQEYVVGTDYSSIIKDMKDFVASLAFPITF